MLATGTASAEAETALRVLSRGTLTATVVCFVALLSPLVTPAAVRERVASMTEGLPIVGGLTRRAADMAATYKNGAKALAGALSLGLVANAAFITSFYAAAQALPIEAPSFAAHLQIVPLAMIAGALPISPNGLGTIEATAEYLYRTLDAGAAVGDGTFAAITHRLVMLAVGVAAVVYSYASGGWRLAASAEPANASNPSEDGSGTDEDSETNASRQSV